MNNGPDTGPMLDCDERFGTKANHTRTINNGRTRFRQHYG